MELLRRDPDRAATLITGFNASCAISFFSLQLQCNFSLYIFFRLCKFIAMHTKFLGN